LRYDKLYKNYDITFRHCYINRFYKYIVAYSYTELFELKHYGLYFCFELAKYCILIFWNYILHYVKLYWSYSCILSSFEFSCIKDFWTYNCTLKWRVFYRDIRQKYSMNDAKSHVDPPGKRSRRDLRGS